MASDSSGTTLFNSPSFHHKPTVLDQVSTYRALGQLPIEQDRQASHPKPCS